jgi:hypothetical protein
VVAGGGVRTRETAAAAVGPGRKTTERGLHVSEGGGEGQVGRLAVIRRGGEGRWAAAGSKPEMGQSSKRIFFRISIDFRNLAKVWKIAQGDLGRNLTCGFFLTSSRLSKYF